MCGFAGFLNYDAARPATFDVAATLARMGQRLSRRGPDEERFFQSDTLSLVFRRLSIVDVKQGHQPIWNEDQTIFVVVNGEIYNHRQLRPALHDRHRLRTDSDSEIVLHLYEEHGPECLRELDGMFAIAIWDTRKQSLFLARDRLGIKPLYYAPVDGGLLFGSELKALLAHPLCPREFNWSDLHQHPLAQTLPAPTYVHGIHHLSGGEYLLADTKGKPAAHQYWKLADHLSAVDATPQPLDHYVNQYGDLLEAAIRRQLMSDVPVGTLLSGGLDSTLLTAIAAPHNRDLAAFTIVNQESVYAGDIPLAQRVCREFDLDHCPVLYDGNTVLDDIGVSLATLEYFVWTMDSPRFDLEWLLKHELYRYVHTRYPELKVLLLGQGTDEFAGGYSRRLDRQFPSWETYLGKQLLPENARHLIHSLGIPERFGAWLNIAAVTPHAAHPAAPYQQKTLRFAAQLQHFNLWHEDRMSSAQSLEARVPYLDHTLVEFLAGIPPSLHKELFWNKRIVRLAAKRFIPWYPDDHLKTAFFVTDDLQSIRRLQRDFLRRVYPAFRAKYVVAGGLLDSTALDRLYGTLDDTNNPDFVIATLFELMCVCIFREQLKADYGGEVSALSYGGSPLHRASDTDIERLRPRTAPPQSELTPTHVPHIAAGVRFVLGMTSASDAKPLIALKDGRLVAELKLPARYRWANVWLEQLPSTTTDHNFGEWATRLNADLPDLLGLAAKLQKSGLLDCRDTPAR